MIAIKSKTTNAKIVPAEANYASIKYDPLTLFKILTQLAHTKMKVRAIPTAAVRRPKSFAFPYVNVNTIVSAQRAIRSNVKITFNAEASELINSSNPSNEIMPSIITRKMYGFSVASILSTNKNSNATGATIKSELKVTLKNPSNE